MVDSAPIPPARGQRSEVNQHGYDSSTAKKLSGLVVGKKADGILGSKRKVTSRQTDRQTEGLRC